jgi:hypothetical protein
MRKTGEKSWGVGDGKRAARHKANEERGEKEGKKGG